QAQAQDGGKPENAASAPPDSATAPTARFHPVLSAAVVAPHTAELFWLAALQVRKVTTTRPQDTTRVKESYAQQILQFNYGLPTKLVLNVGLDVYVVSQRIDANLNRPFWKIAGKSDAAGVSRHAVQFLAPRVRIMPFRRLPELIYQGSLLLPAMRNDQLRQQFGADRVTWQNQLIFYQHLLPRFTAQLQASYALSPRNRRRRQTTHGLAYSLVGIYRLPANRLYALASVAYGENRESSFLTRWQRVRYDVTAGAGAYWQAGPRASLVALAELPVRYDLGSLISEVQPRSWWKVTAGVNYRFARK
ncbi:MAG: hypothetical protein H7Z21_05195, partial [Hymenobacter sp.]|nr:hypothetical protein [Hymenobacter sp.]